MNHRNGCSAAFTRNDDGTHTSPVDNFGTLVKNDDGSYTYTAIDQTLYEFDGTRPALRPRSSRPTE